MIGRRRAGLKWPVLRTVRAIKKGESALFHGSPPLSTLTFPSLLFSKIEVRGAKGEAPQSKPRLCVPC